MKKIILFNLFFATVFSATAQWKTIYEGGFGTPVSLRWDCGWRISVHSGGSSYLSLSESQNGMGIYADVSPFTDQTLVTAGIYKFIPEMGQYASLRVYLDLDLPDSVGTIYYAKLKDTIFKDQVTGTPSWTDVASGISSSLVYFSNFEGNNTIFLNTVFHISPASVFYNYLRVEADTTKVLDVPMAVKPEFSVFSSGKELHIKPSQPDADYEVQLVDLSGKCVYREQKSGQQHIPLDCSKGIYLVMVTQNEISYQQKVYVE